MPHRCVDWMRMAMVCGLIAIFSAAAMASEPIRIIAFGDSTTAVRNDLTIYCDLLQSALPRRGIPVRVINSGRGGDHTQAARERFEKDVLAHHPEIVIIQFGINDAAVDVWKTPQADQPRVARKVFEDNLRHFIQELRRAESKVVLMTPNPLRWTPKLREMYGKPPYQPEREEGFNVLLDEYAEAVRRIAQAESVPLVDVALAFNAYGEVPGQSVGDLLLDGIHPNERGHRLIANALIDLIVRDLRETVPDVLKKPPTMHAEQWENADKADRITDMTRCVPAEALSDRRHHNQWKVFEYETEEFSGKCVSVGRESSAPDLTLKLGKQGWHAVYVGLSSITDLVRAAKNQVEVKFTSDPAFTRLSNRLELGSRRRDVLEEVFLGVADLTKNDLQFSTVYQMPARIHYVKTIPLTKKEVDKILADRDQTATKTSVATFDGFTWIHPFRPQTRADLAATFSAYRDSDFKTWWFQVGGADLVHHPSQVGNLMGGNLDTFPREVDREYV
ncbi:MAG: hypothetical protein KDA80_03755, partial [Planctomycetaceae bacterium]|nr:hypothetical protein [Planctomycetaceae bacterium]